MIYGLILVVSLHSRYLCSHWPINFVSPWSVLVLGFVVIGIMPQVSTIGNYNEAGNLFQQQPLADRYFLYSPAPLKGVSP